MFGLTYIKGVATLKLDSAKCSGCGMCVKVCPHPVLIMRDKKAAIKNIDLCMECGACRNNCPQDAITVNAGVGCAAGVINGFIRGTEPVCDCGDGTGSSSCG